MSRGTICEDKTTEGEERRRGKPLAKVTTSDMRKERRRGGHNCRGGVEWHCVMCVCAQTDGEATRQGDRRYTTDCRMETVHLHVDTNTWFVLAWRHTEYSTSSMSSFVSLALSSLLLELTLNNHND